MTECNFVIKNLSCNFGCMSLERSLIKSVILLANILYCLKKYTSRDCALFLVLGEMIKNLHLFLQRLPVVLVHPYIQRKSHKVLVNLSTNVDSKLTQKVVRYSFVILLLRLESTKTFRRHSYQERIQREGGQGAWVPPVRSYDNYKI